MTLNRRTFLGTTPLLLGCLRGGAAPTPSIVEDGDDDPTSAGGTPYELAAACAAAPTSDNLEGPFYKDGSPRRTTLVTRADRGERLVLSGTVKTTACAPVAAAILDVWHADASGGYDLAGFRFRGKIITDRAGRWQISTVVPGRYLNGDRYRPRHVHVKVAADGHAPLTTQLYFDGDPYNHGDPFIVSSLVMPHRLERGVRHARFDFVLA